MKCIVNDLWIRSTLIVLVGTVFIQNELNDVNWIELTSLVGTHPATRLLCLSITFFILSFCLLLYDYFIPRNFSQYSRIVFWTPAHSRVSLWYGRGLFVSSECLQNIGVIFHRDIVHLFNILKTLKINVSITLQNSTFHRCRKQASKENPD